MKRSTLIIFLFFAVIVANAQTHENAVEQIAAKISLHLPYTDAASLFSDERFIQVGLQGSPSEVNDMLGYFDRFLINGKAMVRQHEFVNAENQVSYYKFYLEPLTDANDFQRMLELSGFKKFIFRNQSVEIQQFSNTVYSFIKSNSKE